MTNKAKLLLKTPVFFRITGKFGHYWIHCDGVNYFELCDTLDDIFDLTFVWALTISIYDKIASKYSIPVYLVNRGKSVCWGNKKDNIENIFALYDMDYFLIEKLKLKQDKVYKFYIEVNINA